MKNAYSVENPDFERSPFTGMTRQHYIDCARYVLTRAFKHVKSFDQAIVFPTIPGSKTYPQPNDPPWRHRSHEWEALERTFTVAGPLMHCDPEIAINGIKLRDYYKLHLYNALTPGHATSLPLPEELPDATYQFTCEFGGLTKTLLLLPQLWESFSKKEQDEMAVTISKWAHHRTTQNNWRIFNICALSFLKKYGYKIDDDLLKSHLMWVASYHAGDGWYLEQTYNYYTISLFVVYCTIWARAFGDKHYPEIAGVLEESFEELFKTYTSFFGKDGFINMWARSICYRLWISGGFPVSFMLKGGSPLDPGFARRLCSGSLLQFTGREEFFFNDVPSLGFYKHAEFAVQSYSCPASPFIMFLPFIALALPEDSPFWKAKENEGFWSDLGKESKRTVLTKPGLVLVNHGSTGASEIVSGKVYDDDHNYSKLTFNTHFPWEDYNPEGGTSQEYSFRSLDPRDLGGVDVNFYLTGKKVENAVATGYVTSQSILFNGVRNDVLYRQLIMRKPPYNGVGYIIDLAEITIPGGVIRVDRCRLAFEHEMTLGHFGLPHMNGQKAKVGNFEDGKAKGLIASIPGRKVALVSYHGWDKLETLVETGRNAEADESTVVYLYRKRTAKNPAMELMITAMLHKTDDAPWTKEELNPIKGIKIMDVTPTNSVLGAEITLANGRTCSVDFKDVDGYKSC